MTDRELVEELDRQLEYEELHAPLEAAIMAMRNRLANPPKALASRPDGWSGIESAPRDGAWVELWMTKPTPHGYASEGPHPVIAKWAGQNCWDVPFEDAWFVDADFTHWRPLPPAPQPDE